MISSTVFRRSAALLLGVTAFGVVPAVSSVSAAPAQCSDASLCAGGEYFPVEPDRVFDSKSSGNIDANGSVTVPMTGVSGIPDEGVLAVAVNVTVAGATSRGYASVGPSGAPDPGQPTSLLNFQYRGHTVPNFGIIGVGEDGAIEIDLTSDAQGTSRVIVDVFGFVATSGFAGTESAPLEDGARMVTVEPDRILDTRPNSPLGPQTSIDVDVRGAQGTRGAVVVPDRDSITAVVVNLTGINRTSTSAITYLSASPDGVADPSQGAAISNGNYFPGTVKANLAIVPLDDDGGFSLYNFAGSMNVAVDVLGYLETGGAEDTTAGRIVPLESPFRSFDTREAEFGQSRLGFSSWEDWSFSEFADSVMLNGASIGEQGGLFGNLTAVGLQRLYPTVPVDSYMTMNPASNAPLPTEPNNSNLNFGEGGATANASLVTYGAKTVDDVVDDNMVSAYNANGRTHYFLDVFAVILD